MNDRGRVSKEKAFKLRLLVPIIYLSLNNVLFALRAS